MRIILPKTQTTVSRTYGPIFFLAGPVRGGGDWQTACCHEIGRHTPHFYAAIPSRYAPAHELMKSRWPGIEDHFDRQLTWERYYLDMAAMSGCIIFWLPCEDKRVPRGGDEPYAMDTRGELGEWRGRLMSNSGLRVVIGAESGFPGLSQIQRNFNFATRTEFPIYPTLAETVGAAVVKAK